MRQLSRRTRLLLASVVILIVVGVAAFVVTRLATPALPNQYTQSPTAFTFYYPAGWSYQIPQVGLLILAQPPTFEGQPGPTFTIHRSSTLLMEGSLEAALDEYMQRGPLRPDHGWEQVGDIQSTTFQDRPALEVEVQGSEFEGWTNLHARIIATRTPTLAVYLFVLAAPDNQWAASQPILNSILDSVELFE